MEDVRERKDFTKLLRDTYHDYLGEFKKIVWPGPKELVKKSVTVILTSIMFGIIIFIIDVIFNWLINGGINLFQGQGWL